MTRIFDPRPWLVAAVVMNVSAVSDGFPTVISAESVVGLICVLTTLVTLGLRARVPARPAEDRLILKAAILIPLLLAVAPLLSQLAARGDLDVSMHPGYRHFVKFLGVTACWAAWVRTRADRTLLAHTLLSSYALLAGVALFRFLVLAEVNPDTGRMALEFRHGDPNFLCVYMVTGTTLALGRLVLPAETRFDRAMKALAALALPAFLATAWFTASRGGLLALGVLLGAAAVFLPGVPARSRLYRAGMVLSVVVLTFLLDGPRLVQRLEFRGDASAMGRVSSLEAGWLGLTRSPVFGLGFKKSANLMREVGASSKFVTVDGGLTIHNTYLQIGAELGVVGLAVYAFALLVFAAALVREHREGSRRNAFLCGVWLAVLLGSMATLPMAYDVTLIGTLLLTFAILTSRALARS